MMQAPAPVSILGDYAEDLLLAQFLQADEAVYENSASSALGPPLPPLPPRQQSLRHSQGHPLGDSAEEELRSWERLQLLQSAQRQDGMNVEEYPDDEHLLRQSMQHHDELEADFAFAMQLQQQEQRFHDNPQRCESEDVALAMQLYNNEQRLEDTQHHRVFEASDKIALATPDLDDLLYAFKLQAEEENEAGTYSREVGNSEGGCQRLAPVLSSAGELQPQCYDREVPSARRDATPRVAETRDNTDLWGAEADALLMALSQQADEARY